MMINDKANRAGGMNRRNVLMGGAALGATGFMGMPSGVLAQSNSGGMLLHKAAPVTRLTQQRFRAHSRYSLVGACATT